MLNSFPHAFAIIGSLATVAVAFILHVIASRIINRSTHEPKEHYRRHKLLNTTIAIGVAAGLILFWSHALQHTSTFLGLIGAGLAIALREPLLSIAGRLAIFAGHMYTVGDRIQIESISGDVIDIGFFYTRMMEIGNWISADQASGRIVQLPNSKIFGTPIFNYTQNFSYIWDEVQLPITFDSNMEQATRILSEVAAEYTREYLHGAEQDLERMRHVFVVPSFDLKPTVYVRVTSNWVNLTMRYIVDPKKRRPASSFIYTGVFKRVRARKDIQIGSETMDLTVHPPEKAA